MMEGKYFLLTGATGLVGRFLMRDLLLSGVKLVVVARSGKRLDVHQRIESILQMWEAQLGTYLQRPVVFEGDVTETDLGLTPEQRGWISDHCGAMIHNAAILQFQGADRTQEPWRTNLGGTENVLRLMEKTGVGDLHYVSTAYVCGRRAGTVYENEFDCGQDFRNDYEHSKFLAEQAVRSAQHLDNVTIYRPAVIVGDSQTGYTSSYHGLYLYLRLLDTIIPLQERDENGVYQTKIKLPMTGDEPRNLITVDWVSSIIAHVIRTPEAHNRTFHLVPDSFTTARGLIDACYKYYNSAGVEYCGPDMEREANSDFSRMFFDNARIYEQYETDDPRFDKTVLEKFIGHIPCPEIDEQMIYRFIEFGKSDNWGKRRERPPVVRFQVADHLDQLIRVARSSINESDDQRRALGFDFIGPGGGAWTLFAEGGRFGVEPGLLASVDQIVRIHPDNFQSFFEGAASRSPSLTSFESFATSCLSQFVTPQ